jgi:hypothetical protein
MNDTTTTISSTAALIGIHRLCAAPMEGPYAGYLSKLAAVLAFHIEHMEGLPEDEHGAAVLMAVRSLLESIPQGDRLCAFSRGLVDLIDTDPRQKPRYHAREMIEHPPAPLPTVQMVDAAKAAEGYIAYRGDAEPLEG